MGSSLAVYKPAEAGSSQTGQKTVLMEASDGKLTSGFTNPRKLDRDALSQFQIGTRRRILNGEKRSTQLLSRGARAIHTKGNAGSPARMLRHHRPPWRRQQPQTHNIPTFHRTDDPFNSN